MPRKRAVTMQYKSNAHALSAFVPNLEQYARTDEEVKLLYLKFREDPINDKYEDGVFCSMVSPSIPIDQLMRVLLNPDIAKVLDHREMGEDDIRVLSNKILQQAYNLLLNGQVSPKSYEGLLNAANNFLKTIQLISGKPTERIAIQELEKKTPEELHTILLSGLRRSMN